MARRGKTLETSKHLPQPTMLLDYLRSYGTAQPFRVETFLFGVCTDVYPSFFGRASFLGSYPAVPPHRPCGLCPRGRQETYTVAEFQNLSRIRLLSSRLRGNCRVLNASRTSRRPREKPTERQATHGSEEDHQDEGPGRERREGPEAGEGSCDQSPAEEA